MSLERNRSHSIDGQWIIDNETNERFIGPSDNSLNVGNQMTEQAQQIEELLKGIDGSSSSSTNPGNNSTDDDPMDADISDLLDDLDILFDSPVSSKQNYVNDNNLLVEISSIERKLEELNKKINSIYIESMGSHFTTLVSEQYPDIYSSFMKQQEEYKKTIADVKFLNTEDKYRKLLGQLEIAKSTLKVYELFYSKFKEVQKEYVKHQSQRNNNLNNQINTSKKEDITLNGKKIIDGLLQQFPDITSIDPNNPNCLRTVDGKYYLNVTNNYIATLGIPISKEDFLTLVDYFEIHPERIRFNDIKMPKQQEIKNDEFQEDLGRKKQVINEIVIAMMNNGEFPETNMDVDKRLWDVQVAEEQLKRKSLEELELLLSTYNKSDENTNSSGLRK